MQKNGLLFLQGSSMCVLTRFKSHALWQARPLLVNGKYHELLDPRLKNTYDAVELVRMVRAATLCLSEHPSARPRMSQVDPSKISFSSSFLISQESKHIGAATSRL